MSESYPPGLQRTLCQGIAGAENPVSIRRHARSLREHVEVASALESRVVQHVSSRDRGKWAAGCTVHRSVSRCERVGHLCRDRGDARTDSTRTPQSSADTVSRDADYSGCRCHWRIPADVAAPTTRRRTDGAGGTVGRKELGERLPVIPTGDELERLSLALNRMIERLETALAHNHRFSADASHELRTPLTIIRGELESLIQMPFLPAVVMEGIGSALEESNRMAKIVHSLMTISRLDCGGEQIEHAPVDLVEVVAITLDHMGLLAEEKHISLSFRPGPAIYVTGDSMRLKQIVVNLVDNAIKYTPDGGDVSVFVTAEEKKAVLKVTDTGIGIPAASLPLVFDRFYRADQARSRESGGTGLGLSIVKAICTFMAEKPS